MLRLMLKVVASGGPLLGAECPSREDASLGCGSHQPHMGDDGAGDCGAVCMRLLFGVERVVAIHDRARELGMSQVDAGIDYRDQHLLALGELVSLPQAELRQRILPGVAIGDQRGGRFVRSARVVVVAGRRSLVARPKRCVRPPVSG